MSKIFLLFSKRCNAKQKKWLPDKAYFFVIMFRPDWRMSFSLMIFYWIIFFLRMSLGFYMEQLFALTLMQHIRIQQIGKYGKF